MKSFIHLFLLPTLLLLGSTQLFAQKPSTKIVETAFHVSGVCGQCKERIETSLDTKGVKLASWDQSTQMLTLAYQPKKISEDQIHALLAEAGHATEKAPAKPEAYAKLPGCCKYETVKSH